MSRPPVYGRNNRDTDQYMLIFSKKALGLNLLACSPCVCMGSLVNNTFKNRTLWLQISRAMSPSVYSADGFFHFLHLAQKKCPDNHADNWWMELSRKRNESIVCKLRKPEKYKQREVAGAARFIFKKTPIITERTERLNKSRDVCSSAGITHAVKHKFKVQESFIPCGDNR